MKRAKTVEDIMRMKFDGMEFDGEWLASIGEPAKAGVWIAWGNSGNGKTRFAMQLAKYLTRFGKVIYDSLEEGVSKSMQMAISGTNMKEVSKQFLLLDMESVEDLKIRLRKRRSADIIIIDSFQYTGMTKKDYQELKEEFGKKKLFIFISHQQGSNPAGRVAEFVRYDADVKILVKGYKAFPVSRFGGGADYVIWEKGASEYWGND